MEMNYYNADSSNKKCYKCKGRGVLLMVLSISLVSALGALCLLGIMYAGKVTLCDASTDQQLNVLEPQSKPENKLSSVCKPCEDGWTAFSGKCYFFSSEEQTWFESRDSCEALGAHLVVINNNEIQDFLVSKITENHWIGLTDLETEGHWVWVNNQTLNETGVQFWLLRTVAPNEPDNWTLEDPSGEDCACMGNVEGYLNKWFDNTCKTQKKKFICQKKYQFQFISDK